MCKPRQVKTEQMGGGGRTTYVHSVPPLAAESVAYLDKLPQGLETPQKHLVQSLYNIAALACTAQAGLCPLLRCREGSWLSSSAQLRAASGRRTRPQLHKTAGNQQMPKYRQ